MRIILSLCAVLTPVLAACAGTVSPSSPAAPNVGLWKIDQRYDRITGTAAPTAMLSTLAHNAHSVMPQPALLQLMCFEGAPIVRLAFDFNIGSAKSTTLSYRFDDKPGHADIKAKLIRRPSKVVILDERPMVAQFVSELATSNTLYVRVASLTAARTNADFQVAGAPAAIEASYAACPVANHASPARKTAAAH